MRRFVASVFLIQGTLSYTFSQIRLLKSTTRDFQLYSTPAAASPVDTLSWQEELDKLLDIDTPCESRRELTQKIVS